MSLQDDFISSMSSCMNPNFCFPPITSPGLPNFTLGMFASAMGGINYVLQYVPPSPQNLPSLPSIDLFLQPFMASVSLPAAYPAFSLGPISIPEKPGTPGWDVSGEFKLIYCAVMLPFQVITGIIEGIISNLSVSIPGIPVIKAIFEGLAAAAGLSGPAIAQFAVCIATALFNLLTALLPV